MYLCLQILTPQHLCVHVGGDDGLYGGDDSRPAQTSAKGQFCSPRLEIHVDSIQCAVLVCVAQFPWQWSSILVSMATMILFLCDCCTTSNIVSMVRILFV